MSNYNSKMFERIAKYSIKDKHNALQKHCLYMIDKLHSMIDIKNLPLTMPKRNIINQLLINGFTFVTEHEDNLYGFYGGLGGEPNAYYDPTICTVANPALKLSKSYVIDKDGVLVRNDTQLLGIIPILEKFGTLDAEITVTFRLMAINNRISALINADDEAGYKSATQFLKNIEDGNLGVIQSGGFFDGVSTNDFSNKAGAIKDMIELSQYLRSLEWEEFGININGNMKREYVNDAELTTSEPAVLPFITNMLENWQEGFDKVNALYGTEIEVEFTPLINYVQKGVNDEEQESSTEADESVSGEPTDTVPDSDDSGSGEDNISSEETEDEETDNEDGNNTEETDNQDNEDGEEVSTQYEEADKEEIIEATDAMNSDTVESEVDSNGESSNDNDDTIRDMDSEDTDNSSDKMGDKETDSTNQRTESVEDNEKGDDDEQKLSD